MRVQAQISQEDFHLLFGKTFWLRGSQDRVISRLLMMLASLLRANGFDAQSFDGMEPLQFFDAISMNVQFESNPPTQVNYNGITRTCNLAA